MAEDLEKYFAELEENISVLQKKYISLKKQYAELQQDFLDKDEKFQELKKENQILAEQQKNIKIQSALTGNPDHNRLMKNYINKLVKEIDTCIAQLQQTGL